MVELWLIGIAAECIFYYLPFLWKYRKVLAGLLFAYCLVTSTMVLGVAQLPFSILFGLLSVFRCINLARVIKGRMHEQYLRRSTTRTGVILLLSSIWSLDLAQIIRPNGHLVLVITLWLQLIVACGLALITIRNIRRSRYREPLAYLSDKELPTVTVAIPARNETDDLEACLRSLLANNYPKLEIIVLDDCSHKPTSEIIKSFAHDGVRFVRGDEPDDRWLAKNHAYEKLYKEASGDFIIFCGVDVRFGEHAIRAMVNTAVSRKKQMLSILPNRVESDPTLAVIQPMRYWWELALPRILFNRPAVLSTCWMIAREELESHGGFKGVSGTIIPEGFFARQLVANNQYSFIHAGGDLDIRTAKNLSDQRDTALRTRYPQLRRRLELAVLIFITEIILVLLPFILAIILPFTNPELLFLPVISCILLIATHVSIVRTTNQSNTFTSLFNFPLAVITELIIGLVSMYRYEFTTVDWKGRNICIPVMHVVPRLPKQ